MKAKQGGFTLIELMVVIAITAILLTLAAPSFARFLDGQRLRTLATSLHSSLVKARSEAIKRNMNAMLVPTSSDMKNGWRICLESDCTTIISNESNGSSDFTITPANTVISYTANGRATANTAISVKSKKYSDAEMCITTSTSGTPQVKRGACA